MHKLKIFIKYDGQQNFQHKNEGRSSFAPTFYERGKKWHIKPNITQNQSKK